MKKTLLSFLCIGSTCLVMAQTTSPSTDPNRKMPTQQPATSTLNNNTNANTLNKDSTPYGNQNLNNNMNMNNSNLNNSNMNNSNLNNTNQNTNDPNTTGTLSSTSANAAYSVSVPTSIQTSFSTAYPTVGNSVIWQQSGEWYRARYMENGKLMEASYREDGKSFTRQASPIMRTYVPEETVDRVLQQYGMNVYAIAASKGADGQNVYNITLIENGQSRTQWINEDGSALDNPYRIEMDEQQQQSHSNMNSTNGQTPATGTVEQTEATPASNSEPATANDHEMDNSPEREPQILEQGEGVPEVTPSNTTNDQGINNGTTSDSLLRERTDAKPEE